MLLVLIGAVTALVGLVVGLIIGIVYGAKFAERILEREGRLIPKTPPTFAQSQKELS